MSNDDEERAQHEALLGQVIANKFKLVRLLGAGGMGAVYEAEDMLLKRRVALKLMKPEVARNKGMAERFIREGRAANAIEHKNIVRVFDLAMDDEAGSLFIVQELLSGESLAERLDREGKLPVGESVVILDSVLEALQFAHGKGIVHRDIKPDNVFLHRGADGEVVPKIIDFGISKVTAEQQEGLAKTQTGTALGTPYYMSPEQIRGDSDIDHRADLWSAGVMAFEMMTGRRPFIGDNYNMLIINIITSPAPDATAVDPAVPSAISQVIARSLRMDRAQRFDSARALREALDDAVLESGARSSQVIALTPASVRSLPPPAAINKADSAVIAADSLVAMTVAPPAPPRESPQRSPAVYALGALVVGLAIAGGAVGLSAKQGDSSASRAANVAAPVSHAPPPETTIAIRPTTTPAPAAAAAPAQAANPAVVPALVAATPGVAPRGNGDRRARSATASPTVANTAPPAAQPSVEPAAQPRVEPAAPAAQPRVEPAAVAASAPAAQPERPAAQPERPAAQPERPAETPATPTTNGTGPAQPRRFRFVTNYPQ